MKEVQNYRWKKYTILILLSLIVIGFFILIGCTVSEKASYPPGNEQIPIRGLKSAAGYDLQALGANFVELEWHFSIDPESWEITADKSERELKKKIAQAHEQGLGVYLLPFLHFQDKPGAVGAVTTPDVDAFLAQLDPLAVGWAQFAEENNVELFTPVNELQHWVGREEGKIGFVQASEWYQSILPKIRKVYSGELVTGYNSFFYDLISQNVSDYEINQMGYDYISLSIVPHRIKNYDDYTLLVDHLIETAEYWKEKFGAKGIIVTEVGVPESFDSLSFYQQGEQSDESYGAMRAHLYDIFFSKAVGKIDGFFISDWGAGESTFYLDESGNYMVRPQGEEVVKIIKNYYLLDGERETLKELTPSEKTEQMEEQQNQQLPFHSKIYGGTQDRILVTFEVDVPEWTREEDKVYLVVNGYMEETDRELIRDLPMEMKEKNVWTAAFRESENTLLRYRYSRNWGEGMTDEIVGAVDDLSVWRTVQVQNSNLEVQDTVKNWRYLLHPKPTAKISDFRPTSLPQREQEFIIGIDLPDWYRKAFGPWVEPTIRRIDEKGFTWIAFIYNVLPGNEDGNGDVHGMNLQLNFAQTRGLNIMLIVPIEAVVGGGNAGEVIRKQHSDEWHKDFVGKWKKTMIQAAEFADSNGITILAVENQWGFFEFTGDAQEKMVNSLVKQALREINDEYTGILVSGQFQMGPNWDFYTEVDMMGAVLAKPLTTSLTPSVAELKESVETIVDGWEVQYQKFGKPILITASYGSWDGAAGGLEGVHFESPEVYEIYSDNPHYPADFQEQADIYEAIFQAIYDEPFIAGIFPFGYKYWDFHDKSPSVRDKPAEDVLKKWNEVVYDE